MYSLLRRVSIDDIPYQMCLETLKRVTIGYIPSRVCLKSLRRVVDHWLNMGSKLKEGGRPLNIFLIRYVLKASRTVAIECISHEGECPLIILLIEYVLKP